MPPEVTKHFRIHDLPAYELGSIAQHVMQARQSGRDIIDLGYFNPDLPPPGVAVDKLVGASLLPHNHRYSASQGISKLRHVFADWYASRFGVELDADREVVVTLGTKEGIAHTLLATLFPGDGVILPVPAYPIHRSAIRIAGAVEIPLSLPITDDCYLLTDNSAAFFNELENILRKVQPKPKMLVMSFPHNPTTTTVSRDFFEKVVAIAAEHDVLLVHDFAYAEISFSENPAPSLLQVREAKERAVEFYSLSKGFSLAGWRIGFCVGNELIINALKKIKSHIDSGAFQPLQIAAISALQQSSFILAETVGTYRARRDALVGGLNEIGWEVATPLGTPFVWSRLPQAFQGYTGFEVAQKLLSECSVAVCPGVGFDSHAEGFLRFSLAEPENRIRQAVRSIGKVI